MHDGHAHQVARAPVALDEAPGAGHEDGVPAVPEVAALEAGAGLVAGRLAVALDHDAVEAGIAVRSVGPVRWGGAVRSAAGPWGCPWGG